MGKRDQFNERQFHIGKRWWRIDYKPGSYVMFFKWSTCISGEVNGYQMWCLKHVWWLK